jgi:gamma-polyglutamate biosynthesis protein CapA
MKISKITAFLGILAILALAAGYFSGKIGERIVNPASDSEDNPGIEGAPATVLAFGDLLLDRYIKQGIDLNGVDYPFKDIKDFLPGNDLVLANLEGSFTDFKPRALDPDNTTFTFDPKLAPMLKQTGFNILNLANNHVHDFGGEGFEQSQAYLDKAGISHFGDFYNEGPAVIKEIRGSKIAFVGYDEFGATSTDSTAAKIKQIKNEADFVVVYAHWGIEYQTNFSKPQQEKAHRFIDAGADVVLGSHPHVVQPIEIYKGKLIFYSLGNFVFDQIFSDQVRHGLAVRLSFDKEKIVCELYSTEMKSFRVNLSSKEKTAQALTWLSKKSIASTDIKAQIASGKFTIEK